MEPLRTELGVCGGIRESRETEDREAITLNQKCLGAQSEGLGIIAQEQLQIRRWIRIRAGGQSGCILQLDEELSIIISVIDDMPK